MLTLAFTHRNAVRLSEIGFVLILLAGAMFAVSELPQVRTGPTIRIVAGLALAGAGLLLIIATHWGRFG